jgi:hypothetical protein
MLYLIESEDFFTDIGTFEEISANLPIFLICSFDGRIAMI